MQKLDQHQSTTERKKVPTKNRNVPRLSRWLHIYISMISYCIVFFFAFTGLTLNHADRIEKQPYTIKQKGQLDSNWVNKADLSSVDKSRIVQWIRRKNEITAALADFIIDDAQVTISFKGPGYAADVFIDRATGTYDISKTSSDWIGILDDLHKGRNTGPVWSIVIDIAAILMLLISLTGILLMLYNRRKRFNGLILLAFGLLILILTYKFFVK